MITQSQNCLLPPYSSIVADPALHHLYCPCIYIFLGYGCLIIRLNDNLVLPEYVDPGLLLSVGFQSFNIMGTNVILIVTSGTIVLRTYKRL